jgi:hypothetical protein
MVDVLNRLSEPMIGSLLTDSASDAIQQLTDLVEQTAWADHAMARERWVWAVGRLIRIVNSTAGSNELKGLSQVARYKLSFALTKIANYLEHEAIKESDDKKFASAKRALCFALAVNQEFLSFEPKESLVIYNDCCTNALLARVMVHEWPPVRTQKLTEVKASTKEPDGALYEAAWTSTIGKSWRDSMPADRIKVIEDLGYEAWNRLQELVGIETEGAGPPRSFWFDRAKSDPDLLFLWRDREFEKLMDAWTKGIAVRGMDVNPFVQSVAAIQRKLPENLCKSAESLFASLDAGFR